MEYYHVTLILLSVIDRAGIPVSYLTGAVLLQNSSTDLWLFTVLCICAGSLGDALMYTAGRYVFSKGDTSSPFYKATLNYKVKKYAAILEPHSFLWIVGSRLFQLINQFILLGIGVNKYPAYKAFVAILIGNITYFSMFSIIFQIYTDFVISSHIVINTATGLIGIILLVIIFRIVNNKAHIYVNKGRGNNSDIS